MEKQAKKYFSTTLILAIALMIFGATHPWFFNFKKSIPKAQQKRASNTALHVAAAFQGWEEVDFALKKLKKDTPAKLAKLSKIVVANHTHRWEDIDIFGDLAKNLLEYMELFFKQPDIASDFAIYDDCLRSFFQALEKNRVAYHTKNGIPMDFMASIERLKANTTTSFAQFKTMFVDDIKPYMLSTLNLLKKGPHWSPYDRRERFYIPAQNLIPQSEKERVFLKKYLDTLEALHDKLSKATTNYISIGQKLYDHGSLTAPDESYSIDTEKLEDACGCLEFIMQERNQEADHQEPWQSRKHLAELSDETQTLILECAGAKQFSYYKPYILHAVLFDAITALYEAFVTVKHTENNAEATCG